MKGVASWKRRARREADKGAPEGAPRHRSSKDTRAWCKGVEGRPHDWGWVEDLSYGSGSISKYANRGRVYSKEICRQCRKTTWHSVPQWGAHVVVAGQDTGLHGPGF